MEQLFLLAPLRVLRRCWRRMLFVLGGMDAINAYLRRSRYAAEALAQFGATVTPPAVVHAPLIIHNAGGSYRNLTVGSNVHIGPLVILDLAGPVVIGADVTVSMGSVVLTHSDVGDRPLAASRPRFVKTTRLGDGCWIGANATILPGCSVGSGSVVGAGAVVTHALPDETIAVGVPARPGTPT